MTDQTQPGALDFGPDFLFGSATASYQIEGAVNEDGRGPSIWDTFSHTPGKVVGGDTGDVADDHYHHLDEDLDLMARYNLGAYRFSIAWPRIQPTGSGAVNPKGIDFYDRLIDGLLERGIQPTCTLYHWDLPQPLEDRGGWPERETAERFAEYAEICGKSFGDRITQWTTLNEAWCIAYLGYVFGVHAPGRTNPVDGLKAAHTLNLAHGKALQALRAVTTNNPRYSITHNLQTVDAASDSPADLDLVERRQHIGNRIFTSPQLKGHYEPRLFEMTDHLTDWSFVQDGDLADIHQPIDVLGLNWYNPLKVRSNGKDPKDPSATGYLALGLADDEGVEYGRPKTDMGWEIVPEGLTQQLLAMRDEFGELPIVITENGCAFDDPVVDGRVHDARRVDYLHQHLSAVHRAKELGARVEGYYVWSLMDNYEWAEGYAKRFGITHVDYETLVRTPKDSALWFSELARTKVLPERDCML